MKYLKALFYSFCSVLMILFCLLIGHLKAERSALIISEVKVKNDVAGFDEYIELYNSGSEAISLNNYFIGYTNTATPATGQALNTFVLAQGLLEAGKSIVLAKNESDLHLPYALKSPFSSLSDSAGTLQLTD